MPLFNDVPVEDIRQRIALINQNKSDLENRFPDLFIRQSLILNLALCPAELATTVLRNLDSLISMKQPVDYEKFLSMLTDFFESITRYTPLELSDRIELLNAHLDLYLPSTLSLSKKQSNIVDFFAAESPHQALLEMANTYIDSMEIEKTEEIYNLPDM